MGCHNRTVLLFQRCHVSVRNLCSTESDSSGFCARSNAGLATLHRWSLHCARQTSCSSPHCFTCHIFAALTALRWTLSGCCKTHVQYRRNWHYVQVAVCHMGIRCMPWRTRNWDSFFTHRYASTYSMGIRCIFGRDVFLRTFAVASSCIYFRILFGIRLFLYNNFHDDSCANAARTRSSRSRARIMVHGIWRPHSIWQYGFWSAH